MSKTLLALTLALCLASAAAFVPSAPFKIGSPAIASRCALAPALRQVCAPLYARNGPADANTCRGDSAHRGERAATPAAATTTGQRAVGDPSLLSGAGAGAGGRALACTRAACRVCVRRAAR